VGYRARVRVQHGLAPCSHAVAYTELCVWSTVFASHPVLDRKQVCVEHMGILLLEFGLV
jgi:hypothetical protein